MTSLWIAFGLTAFAGLSTGIGSLIAFFTKKTNPNFLAVSLGFSAGVMIYISLIEFLTQSKTSLSLHYGVYQGQWVSSLSFFVGIGMIWLIDSVIPSKNNLHEPKNIEEMNQPLSHHSLERIGLMTALSIAIHNFPEGLATFASALQTPSLGISISVAVALHNIPEGIAVSVPIFYATGSRKKAFVWSFLSGLTELIGAFIGFAFLQTFLKGPLEGIFLAFVAGIMVFISLDELLPTAEKYGKHHLAISGVIAGMAIMAITLLVLQPISSP
jgi:ZIP family zinc transporter